MPTSEIFRDFERDAITRLCAEVLSRTVLDAVFREAEFVDLDHSGCGYHLTIRHDALPQKRCIGDTGIVLGKAEDVLVGFVVYLQDNELTLDCHNIGDAAGIPNDIRDRSLEITSREPPLNGED